VPLNTLYAARRSIVVEGAADLDSAIPLPGIVVSPLNLPACLMVHESELCNKYSLGISGHCKAGIRCNGLNAAG